MQIYIPYILNKYTKQDIINIFKYGDIGDVDHIELYRPRSESNYNSAVVHMKGLYVTDFASEIYNNVFVSKKPYIFYPEVRNRDISWLLMKQED